MYFLYLFLICFRNMEITVSQFILVKVSDNKNEYTNENMIIIHYRKQGNNSLLHWNKEWETIIKSPLFNNYH